MTTHIEMTRNDTAIVTSTPSLIRRMLFREAEKVRVAVCVCGPSGWRWIWDDTALPVDARTVELIDRAAVERRKQQLATAHLTNLVDVRRELVRNRSN